MFKKSLLALALSATAFGAAASKIQVGTLIADGVTHTSLVNGGKDIPAVASTEGLALAKNLVKFHSGGATVAGENVALKITLGTDYPASSVFVIEVAGADFDTSAAGVAAPTMIDVVAANEDLTLLDASDAKKLVFNVGGTATKDDAYILNAALKNVTGDVTFTVYANAPVIQGFDKSSFKAITTAAQHKVKTVVTTKAKIDVAEDRKAFTTNNTGVEDFSVLLERESVNIHSVEGYNDTVTKNAHLVTLNGDFSYLDTDADQKLDDEKVTVAGTGSSVLTLAKDGVITLATANNTSLAATGLDFTVNTGNTTVLKPTDFSATVASKYQLASDNSLKATYTTDVAFGSWSLNGSVVEVPYLPFGDNTAVVLRLTNTSAKTGDLTVRYLLEDSVNEWKSVGVVGSIGPGVTNISDIVMDAIKADADVTKGKVAIELTTNVPSDNVDITAIFKVISDADRGVVATK